MRRSLLIPLAALALAPASAQAADPKMWQTPSGNIACASFSKSFLRCDMRELGNPAEPQPSSCEFDYGRAFGVTRNGRGKRLCISDAVGGPGTPTVGYGTTWRRNGFRCTVKRSGVRCTNRRGHGFFLRRGKQTLF